MAIGFAALVLACALVSRRLVDGPVTPPAIFALAGALAAGAGLAELDVETESVVILAEATLTVILFVDAARIPLSSLRRFAGIPLRLLAIGLPISVVLGTLIGRLLLALDWPQAVMLGGALGATDAALGRVVISSPKVPARISQSLNVESGLNDGMVVPVITFAIGVAAAEAGGIGNLPVQIAFQILLGIAVGGFAGWTGGYLLRRLREKDLVDGIFGQLATVAVAALAYLLATAFGGNGFIAAFAAGLGFGRACGEQAEYLSEFSEDAGRLLNLVAFFVFGVVLLEPTIENLSWPVAATALLMLGLVRPIAAGIALIGSRLGTPSVLYLGWFGPRGLASILFAFVFAEELDAALAPELTATIALTVLLSVLAHGATAQPLTGSYSRWYSSYFHEEAAEGAMQMPDDAPRMRV